MIIKISKIFTLDLIVVAAVNLLRNLIASQDNPHTDLVSEIGLGMTPKAQSSRDTLENEHIYGGFFINFHTDTDGDDKLENLFFFEKN